MNRGYLNTFEQTILYVLIFFILQEWLKPIMELTGTGYFAVFSLFIALCLVVSLFNLPFIAVWASKIIFIGWFIERIYNQAGLTVLEFFKKEITANFEAITNANWGFVTNGFRTFLFFVLIWMLVYLIHHWITVRMSIFYFLVMTVLFIATLDTLSEYDGDMAIVKVLLIGLLMTSLLFVKRFILKRSILIDWQKIIKYMIPVVLFVGFAGVVALILPKAAPQWPDPVGYFENFGSGTSMGNGSGIGSSQKVGYGDNDEHLGGAFTSDDTTVFEVNTLRKQYWRVETKDTYTSKGWINSSKGVTITFSQSSEIEHSINVGVAEDAEVATITNLSTHAFLLQPYGLINFDASKNSMGSAKTEVDALTEKMHLKEQSMTQSPILYDVNFSEPSYSFIDLKEAPVGGASSVEERYLDLPDSLPQRVKDLALEITMKRSSTYDKARAIESYFSRNGFNYETKNVGVPGEDQDYVDQFLFETKAGYCDNFSTSMVVMLRAVDIPARWVKGFVTGEIIETYEDGRSLYEISNNEAHSWVEAYIEGVGWVPFEPTIGYSNPADIDFDLPEDAGNDELLPDDEEDPLEGDKDEPKEQTIEEQPTPGVEKESGILKWLKIILAILGAAIILAAGLAYSLRKKWLPKYYIQQNRKQGATRKNYVISYERLLKQLTSYGLKRGKGQTLQVYAARVDAHFGSNDMSKLTKAYERLIYSKNFDETEFNKMKESWENLINRSIG